MRLAKIKPNAQYRWRREFLLLLQSCSGNNFRRSPKKQELELLFAGFLLLHSRRINNERSELSWRWEKVFRIFDATNGNRKNHLSRNELQIDGKITQSVVSAGYRSRVRMHRPAHTQPNDFRLRYECATTHQIDASSWKIDANPTHMHAENVSQFSVCTEGEMPAIRGMFRAHRPDGAILLRSLARSKRKFEWLVTSPVHELHRPRRHSAVGGLA